LLILAASFHTLPTTIDIFLLIAFAAALRRISRSLALNLLSSHLPSSPSYPLKPPTMQASQAANATEGAFDFLGLPKELRLMVYRELFGKREERGFCGTFHNLQTDRVLVIDSLDCERGSFPPQINLNPAILSTCHEVRAEAGAIYYSKQDLYLDYEYSDVLQEILSWADLIVQDLAIYLRDVRVHICALGTSRQQQVQFQHVIHLKFSPDRGLTVEGWKGAHLWEEETNDQYQWIMNMDHLQPHVAAIEAARAPGRQGGAIIDFFSHNHSRLRDACFGPPIKKYFFVDAEGRRLFTYAPCHPNDRDIVTTRKRFW
jgi:hypothetical protein